MIRDRRIKDVQAGEFRSKLYVDCVLSDGGDFVFTTSESGHEELVNIYHQNPIACPIFTYMHYIKVNSVKDKFFKTAVKEYTYINPNIDERGLYLMSEHIQKFLIRRDSDTMIPIIGIQDIFKEVKRLHKIYEKDDDFEVCSDTVCVFKRDSSLTKDEKISFSRKIRAFRNSLLQGELIHNKAQELISITKNYATRKRDVYNNVKGNKGLNTYNSFNKHILSKTEEMLEEDYNIKLIKSQKEYLKLKEYNKLRKSGKTTEESLKMVGIGKQTAINFNAIIKRINNGTLDIEI